MYQYCIATNPRNIDCDGGKCLLYVLKELPGNFCQICSKVFDLLGKTGNDIFSTDQYFPNSVKSIERRHSGCGEKLVLKGEATKRPADWKSFLGNDDNKVQFIRLILKCWSRGNYAIRFHGRRLIFICDGTAHLLTSSYGSKTVHEEIPSLESSQEETYSRSILYLAYAKERVYQYTHVKSPYSCLFCPPIPCYISG